ncbi:MAG TPA: hypothetical protein VF831_09215 [Anaerolineales bacterium]
MNRKPKWKPEYDHEIEHAISARSKGNEGMARVCARRAAGIVIGEYLLRRGYTQPNSSAYDRLTLFNSLPEVNEDMKVITSHFLLRVSHDHTLPGQIDLISEAQCLKKTLLLDSTN